jgi:hypothetical protein
MSNLCDKFMPAKPLTAALFVLLAGGCAYTGGVEPPQAKVTSVSILDETPQGARLQVMVELSNNNTTALPLVQCDYAVSLQGLGTFRLSDRPNRTLPGRRTDIHAGPATQVLPLTAAFATQGQSVKGLQYNVTGQVTFEPPGEIRKLLTDSSIPLPASPFSASGKVE